MRILIEGSIEGTYSLSLVNQYFGKALIDLGQDVYFSQPDAQKENMRWLQDNEPAIYSRYLDRQHISGLSFDVHSRNHYPMTGVGLVGAVNAIHCFGWEESIFPNKLIDALSAFDFLTFMSTFCLEGAKNSGLSQLKAVVGLGLDHLPELAGDGARPQRGAADPFTFLHISSGLKRKGMDPGLQAFVEEFEHDNVRLVIKTYPNATNEIPHLIENLRGHPILSRIDIDQTDMSSEAMAQLINRADALYLPSFGEGFSLPAAEAMIRRRPVVTTDCGGNSDFCSDETCLLVPTMPRRTRSHVGRRSAMWFEPKVSDLRRALRSAVDMPAAERTTMLDAAHAKVARYTWQRAAQSFIEVVDKALAAKSGRAVAKTPDTFVLMTTFEQRCGLATYSEQLAKAILAAGLDCAVFTEDFGDPDLPRTDALKVFRIWKRTWDSLLAAARSITQRYPGCPVILQFHAGIISWVTLREICGILKRAGNTVIVEVHSVNGLSADMDIRSFLADVDKVIVHSDSDYIYLAEVGLVQRLSLFVHPIPEPMVVAGGAEQAGRPMLSTFGMCGRHKRFELVLRIVDELRQRGRDVGAEIVSSVDFNEPESVRYAHELYRLSCRLGLDGVVKIVTAFLPMREIETMLGASRLALFPYSNVSEGASGAVRVAISVGVPVLTSKSPIFEDLEMLGCQQSFDNIEAISDVVEDYIFDQERRDAAVEKQRVFKASASWSQHVKRIEDLLSEC